MKEILEVVKLGFLLRFREDLKKEFEVNDPKIVRKTEKEALENKLRIKQEAHVFMVVKTLAKLREESQKKNLAQEEDEKTR